MSEKETKKKVNLKVITSCEDSVVWLIAHKSHFVNECDSRIKLDIFN